MSVRHYFRRPPAVSAAEAMRLIRDGALVIDVRGEREYRRQHIPGAVHIALADLEARSVDLPEDRLLLTFCTGGLLSSGAANLLTELGFTATNMSRGLLDWRAAGGPLEVAAPG